MREDAGVTGTRRIVRADVLADVAPVEPIADGGVERGVDRALAFDREVRDATRGVDAVGRDGSGRAGVDAAGAGATMIAGGRLIGKRFELEGGVRAAEEEIAAIIGKSKAVLVFKHFQK